MPIVVDPSAILGLALDDEAADFAGLVLGEIETGGALAPSIFWYEVRNVLVANERRGRITPDQTDAFLASLADLPIELSPLPPDLGVLDLARRHGLTVYDAAYLELASRSGVSLATLDSQLRGAARSADIHLFLDQSV